MVKVLLCLIIPILTIIRCSPPSGNLSDKEAAAIVETIKTTLYNYYADIRKEGLTAEFRYLDHSEQFYWAPPGFSSPISYTEVEKALKQNAVSYSVVDNKWTSLRIDPLNHEYASYTGRITSAMTDTSGTVSTYNLIETGLMIKRSDGWKLLRGQTSVLE